MVAGDFNVTKFAHERCGRRADYQDVDKFVEVIRELDIPLKWKKIYLV